MDASLGVVGVPSPSQIAIDLNDIVQSSKRRAIPSGGKAPTIVERQSIESKRQRALAAVINNARKLETEEDDQPEPTIPSSRMVEQIAYHFADLLSGASEAELDQMVELSKSRIDTAAYIYDKLIAIGVFNSMEAASRYLETKDLWTTEYIRLFAGSRGWVSVITLSALLHLSPLVPNTTLVMAQADAINALATKYSMSVDEDQVPRAATNLAKQRLETAISTHHLDSEFFSMKRAQVVKNGVEVTSLVFSDTCPLFSKYDNGRLLSSGNFGVVFKYARRDSLMKGDNVPLFCVVKIQKTSQSNRDYDAGLRELLVMSAIDSKIRGWAANPVTLITNAVMLYDWVKCKMSLPRVLKSVLSAEDIAKLEVPIDEEPHTYQILVEEYVDEGEIESVLEASDLFWNTKSIAAMYAQLFGFFAPFYHGMRFMHNDLKTPNVLLKRMPVDSTLKYLHYNHPSHAKVWVPLEATHGFIFKLADFGVSMIKVGRETVGRPDWVAQPGLDLEVFTVWLLYNAARYFKSQYMIRVPPELLQLFRSIILPPHGSDDAVVDGESRTSGEARARVIELLSSDRFGKEAPNWSEEADDFLGIYTYAKNIWPYGSVYPDHRGMTMITRLFSRLTVLTGFGRAPPDLASHNVCDMTTAV